MPNFETYVGRHGEGWTLFIVEQIERVEGIRYWVPVCLEERWNALMDSGCAMQQRMAA